MNYITTKYKLMVSNTKISIKCHQMPGWVMRLIFYILFSLSIGMVDTIFADVAQPDQARIVAINAHHFLKNAGHIVISIKVIIIYIFKNKF
jgi:hypothetical protein